MDYIERQYKCTCCHHEWPARQPPGDEQLKYCPFCDHQQIQETTQQETKEGNQ